MMMITDIRKTRRERFALFGDEGFLFSVDAETLAIANIQTGSSLSDGELALLKENSDIRKAKDTGLRYLSLRAYGERELYDKLLQRYDEHTSAAVVAQMCALELLCDETFALEKAKGMAERGKSPGAIRQKLNALGIDRDLSQRIVASLNIDACGAALELVQKQYMDTLQGGGRQKVMAALARRGFSHRDIVAALASAMEELESDIQNEWTEGP